MCAYFNSYKEIFGENRTNPGNKSVLLSVCMFICGFSSTLEFSLIWRRHHYRSPRTRDTHTHCQSFGSGVVTTFLWLRSVATGNIQLPAGGANVLTHCATAAAKRVSKNSYAVLWSPHHKKNTLSGGKVNLSIVHPWVILFFFTRSSKLNV